jgi:hypothetical protein
MNRLGTIIVLAITVAINLIFTTHQLFSEDILVTECVISKLEHLINTTQSEDYAFISIDAEGFTSFLAEFIDCRNNWENINYFQDNLLTIQFNKINCLFSQHINKTFPISYYFKKYFNQKCSSLDVNISKNRNITNEISINERNDYLWTFHHTKILAPNFHALILKFISYGIQQQIRNQKKLFHSFNALIYDDCNLKLIDKNIYDISYKKKNVPTIHIRYINNKIFCDKILRNLNLNLSNILTFENYKNVGLPINQYKIIDISKYNFVYIKKYKFIYLQSSLSKSIIDKPYNYLNKYLFIIGMNFSAIDNIKYENIFKSPNSESINKLLLQMNKYKDRKPRIIFYYKNMFNKILIEYNSSSIDSNDKISIYHSILNSLNWSSFLMISLNPMVPSSNIINEYNSPGFGKSKRHNLLFYVRTNILPELPIEKMTYLLIKDKKHPNYGRPSIYLQMTVGMLILQGIFNYTNEELLDLANYDQMTRWSLYVDGDVTKKSRISRRAWYGFKEKARLLNFDDLIFETIVKIQVEKFYPDECNVRQDVCQFYTNSKPLGRVGLFRAVIKHFLKHLKNIKINDFEKLDINLTSKYIKDENDSWECFGAVKRKTSGWTLKELSEDLFILITKFRSEPVLHHMESYKLMERLLRDQCNVITIDIDGNNVERVEYKHAKDVKGNSLQSVSDPDVSYNHHKGKGLQVQLAEVFDLPSVSDIKNKIKKTRKPIIIIYVKVEGAHVYDGDGLLEAMKFAQAEGFNVIRWLADTSYGSLKNFLEARNLGIELISPVPGKKPNFLEENSAELNVPESHEENVEPKITLITEARPEECPNGKSDPIVEIDLGKCLACPLLTTCLEIASLKSVKNPDMKRKSNGENDENELINDERREYMKHGDGGVIYRFRSGGESTNSILKNCFGMDRLRVRGIRRSQFAIKMMAIGFNIKKIVVWNRNNEWL